MEPQILPVSMPRHASSASISSTLPSSSAAGNMLLKAHDDSAARLLFSPPSLEDGTGMGIMPLLGRSSSFPGDPTAVAAAVPGGGSKMNEKRRRRFISDPSVTSDPGCCSQGSQRDVCDGASGAFLLTRLGLKLLRYIGMGCRWISRLFALGCYSLLIAPGVLQVAYYYCFSSHIRRGIVYGDQPRNKLDLYFPKNSNGPMPVVAFVTGGAWIIGYKAWGALLGKHLSESNIMVACIDYRNFPQVNISDMVKDASQGISFICNNIAEYGGDPNRIFLMGQSAGAHIASCALVEQAINEAKGQHVSWSVSKINAYFGLSGGYNMSTLMDFLRNRGLCDSIFLSIMGGEQSLQRHSPEVLVQDPNNKAAVSLLPPIVLFHGTADYSIPSYCSKSFAEALQKVGVKAKSIMYEGKTHTDLFVQDPMRGGQDEMLKALVSLILGEESEAGVATQRRLAPELFLKLAGWVSPF